MKYEATVSCTPLFKTAEKVLVSTKAFDSLSCCLSEILKTFEVEPDQVEVDGGVWTFVKVFNAALPWSVDPSDHDAYHRPYRYEIKVKRVDPVLPSELKRELEKLC